MIDILFLRFATLRRMAQQKFWQWYCVRKCIDRGVILLEEKSTIFNGHCFLNIIRKSTVEIGLNFVCNSGLTFGLENFESKIIVAPKAVFKVGNNSGMSSTLIGCYNEIIIGDNVNIGGGTRISDSNFHSIDWRLRLDRSEDAKHIKTVPIHIEDNVFIGARCIIGKGVTIGARSIIAAGSVVIKDIPSDCIAGGNPCKIIKML